MILFLFAHGAGAPSSSKWMKGWAKRLGKLGKVVPFDYPYARAGRKAPDRLPKLIEAHREALAKAKKKHPRAKKLVLIGKSMGGRVGCHLSLEEKVNAVVCLGYPLRSPKGVLRDEVLKEMKTKILFVQGTRDPLAPLDVVTKVRKKLKQRNALHIVETGNHSLEITKTRTKETGEVQAEVDAVILGAIKKFLV